MQQLLDINEQYIPTVITMNSLENYLFQVNWLGLIGGADVRDCTWRILKRVIANSLAKNLNWRGVNGKTSLATLQLREVVISKYICLEILFR